MVCFTRVSEPTVGKQYITYSRNIGLQILGTYLENDTFEYEEASSLEHLCELRDNDGEITVAEIEDFLHTIQEYSIPDHSPIYNFTGVMAKLEIKKMIVSPVDPKLLRLREMLKKI